MLGIAPVTAGLKVGDTLGLVVGLMVGDRVAGGSDIWHAIESIGYAAPGSFPSDIWPDSAAISIARASSTLDPTKKNNLKWKPETCEITSATILVLSKSVNGMSSSS
jgi:hypothetical protein